MKEMQPLYVATYSEKPAVLEGHPFIVEAGVSLGGAEVSGSCLYLAPSFFVTLHRCCLFEYRVFSMEPFCLLFAPPNSKACSLPPCFLALPLSLTT